MILSAPFRNRNRRLRLLGWIIGTGLFVLLAALWRVQVIHGSHYDSRQAAQSLRRIRIPSARGEIVDRNGVVLARNRPSYDIALYLDQLGRVSKRQDIVRVAAASIGALSRSLGLPVTLAERDVRLHYQRRRPIPMPVWRDVRVETVAAFVERAGGVAGADLVVTPVREYPHGALAAHVLGYVGRAEHDPDEELEHFYYYQPDTAGRQGVELACDEFLRGAPGGQTIRVSPGGAMVERLGERPAQRGHRVVLSLDVRIQRLAEQALARAELPPGRRLRGAVVVLNARSGEVLAMASVPSFDPNLFGPATPAERIRALLNDPDSPMLNRAIAARYAPGSTFKPVTLLAALECGSFSLSETVLCSGGLQIGNWPRPFRCWNRSGHGRVDGLDAMKQSCDVWFYQCGMASGADALARFAGEFGLGEPTGFDLGRDASGLVPTPGWKRLQRGERWWDGDTAQMAIGQSFLLVTPLQMACVAAAFGNGGTVWRPFVVRRIETAAGEVVRQTRPEVRRRVRAAPHHMEAVRQTMLAAVQAPEGTAHRAAVRGLSVAGKTGTAEFDTPRGRIKRAWFIGFAPYEDPQVAVSVLIEDGESGGHTAAPVAGEIFAGIFGKQPASVARSAAYAD